MIEANVIAISTDIRVRLVGDSSVLSDADIKEIDRIWSEATSAADQSTRMLFDGDVLYVVTVADQEVICRALPYRFFYAQRSNPELRSRLGLGILAVSGVTLAGNRVIFGRRSLAVTQHAHRLELVPSGSVDARFVRDDSSVDYRAQLLQELDEELAGGLSKHATVTPAALLWDAPESTLDLCCRIDLPESCRIPSITAEYSQIFAIPVTELNGFVQQYAREFVPGVMALLKHLALAG